MGKDDGFLFSATVDMMYYQALKTCWGFRILRGQALVVPFLKRLMCTRCATWDAVPHPAKGLRLLKPFVFNAIALKKASCESFA
jgi:hypothetical protein